MLKRLISKLKKNQPVNDSLRIQIIPRDDHTISRTNISENALKVLYRLKKAGYEAYLVGGGVRDLLLGQEPKDFDVVTNAHPEQVHRLFKNSRLIGKRFRLVHVIYGRDIIEVATFRGHHSNAEGKQQAHQSASGMLLRDNVYGDINEDAMRRDFTVNALYYNIENFAVHSYAGGIEDIEDRLLRLIGDPETRYREDPVRMLRAVRFAAKLDFDIEEATAAPIVQLAPLLRDIPPARLFEEVLKLFMAGQALETFRLLEDFDLFGQLFPQTQQCLDESEQYRQLIEQALVNSDERIAQGKTLTPAFLFAVFLWPPMIMQSQKLEDKGMPPAPAMHQAATQVLNNQQARIAIPRRFITPLREIWDLQRRLLRRQPKFVSSTAHHPRFRAAYDFLLLREATGENLNGAGAWWTQYQQDNEIKSATESEPKKRRSNFRPRKRSGKPRQNRR